MANNVIGIKFGVLGGKSISGESGRLIKEQLESLSSKVKLKVNIDKPYFTKQLQSLKSEMEKTLGSLKIDVKAANTGGGSSSDGGAKETSATYEGTRKTLEQLYQTKLKLVKIADKPLDTVITQGKAKELEELYAKQLSQLRESKDIDAEKVRLIEQYMEQLRGAQEAEAAKTKQERAAKEQKAKQSLYATETDLAKLQDKAASLSTTNGFDKIIKRSEEAKQLVNDFKYKVMSLGDNATKDQVKDLNAEFIRTQARLREIGEKTDTTGNKIKEAFDSHIIQAAAAALLSFAVRALKQVYNNVVELDKAVTNLQIATGYTRAETAKLLSTYADLAKQLGATMTEVADAADTWLRQGYSVAETNELITNSMMLSKLGQLGSSDAAKALTSAMKGYKVEVEDSIGIVDKLTAVDMQAAVSAGDIATAMAETAAGADVAGVSMDKLIGYISTVAEVTQDGAESVGTFYKTLFARMGNIKAGNFVDDETGESLNDVEKVLGNVGISLRDSKDEFRDFDKVLDDVAEQWNTYSSVQQHALATAFAGTRQQEKFIVLMENYGDALNYAATAANSAGTAQSKYNEAYLDSIEAKLNELTASWEEFSTLILDSELVKGAVDFLSLIANLLNRIAGIGDGMLVTIPAITIALVALHAILLKIKSTTVFVTMWSSLKSILMIFPAIIAGLKSVVLNIIAEAAAHKMSRNALIAKTAATKAATAAQEAFNATNPVGWIILAVTAILALVKGISALAAAEEKASKAAKEDAENKKELADKAKEEQDSLDELIDKYAEVADTEYVDADKRQEIRDLQKQINLLVGQEAESLDLVNDGLDVSMAKLKALKLEQARQKQSTFTASYSAAENSANKAYESDRSDAGWAEWAANLAGIDIVVKGYDKAADEILNRVQGVSAGWDSNIGSSLLDINFDVSGADEYVRVINNAIEALENDQNYNHWDSEVYNKLVQMRDSYQEYVNSTITAANDLLANTVTVAGLQKEVEEKAVVDSIESYKAFKDSLEQTVSASDDLKKALNEGRLTQDDITEAVNDYMSLNFPDYYNKIAESVQKAVVSLKDFLEILNEIEDEFDVLQSALSDIEKQGIVSADTISKILEEYQGLEKYFTLTPSGYMLADAYKEWSTSDILKHYVTEYLQTYVDELAKCEEGTENYATAEENLNNAIAVCATLLRSAAIEEETERLNANKDALEDQLDKYKELIDIRKDLLETYKEEIDYQKELAQKQKNVADLETQLAIAKLDKSATGQAKVRELQEELESAQDELDDFTLDKAIDVLTAELDDSYNDYKEFIDDEIEEITSAIDDLKTTINPGVTVPEPTKEETPPPEDGGEDNPTTKERWTSWQDAADAGFSNIAGAGASERSRVKNWTNSKTGNKYTSYQEYLDVMYEKYMGKAPKYHSGGFVDDYSNLQSNEVFAKLLRGEFVSTPAQMDKFVKETLPMVAAYKSGEATINYNSPLIEIQCGSVSDETLPKLNDLVNKAVERIKKDMTGALSRTGYRKQY